MTNAKYLHIIATQSHKTITKINKERRKQYVRKRKKNYGNVRRGNPKAVRQRQELPARSWGRYGDSFVQERGNGKMHRNKVVRKRRRKAGLI